MEYELASFMVAYLGQSKSQFTCTTIRINAYGSLMRKGQSNSSYLLKSHDLLRFSQLWHDHLNNVAQKKCMVLYPVLP